MTIALQDFRPILKMSLLSLPRVAQITNRFTGLPASFENLFFLFHGSIRITYRVCKTFIKFQTISLHDPQFCLKTTMFQAVYGHSKWAFWMLLLSSVFLLYFLFAPYIPTKLSVILFVTPLYASLFAAIHSSDFHL